MSDKRPTKRQIESLAKELRKWLLDHDLWVDVTIYFNGKAFSTMTQDMNTFAYNDPKNLIVWDDADPHKVTQYAGDIMTVVFEGDLYLLLNYPWDYGFGSSAHGWKLNEEFHEIFRKYGLYFELGESWNLTAFVA